MTTTTTTPPAPTVPIDMSFIDDRPGRFGDLFRDSAVFARRNLEHIRQIPEKLLDVTIQPIMFVLLFAYVFGGAIHVDGGSYREFLIGGILVQSLAFGLMGPAMSIATDLREGVVDRFRSLPASRPAYLCGHYLAELAGAMLSLVILLASGFVIGWRAHTGVLETGEALLLLAVFSSAMIWLGTWLGMLVRSPDAAQGIVFVTVFPLTFLSSAFVPIQTLPDPLQWVASWNPISAVVAAVRELFGNPASPIAKDVWPMQHPVAAAWLFCALLVTFAVPVALHRFTRRATD
jgi:ABC-2 type transport system permease protein